jgi:uncharacterized protein DUF6677
MATAASPLPANVPTHDRLDPAAALLSYLIPGLGQIVQGRVGKGLLFAIGIYSLFFYGMALGQCKNVYFGDTITEAQKSWSMPRVAINLFNRPQFAGQFWVGMVAWPAIYHYVTDQPTESPQHKEFVRNLDKHGWLQRTMVAMPEDEINRLQRDSDKRWDLGWVYTVIAGVLNVLVIYDALAGPAYVHSGATPGGGKPP